MAILIKGGYLALGDCKAQATLRQVFSTPVSMSGLTVAQTKPILLREFENATINNRIFLCNFIGPYTRLYACRNKKDVEELFNKYVEGSAASIEFYGAPVKFFEENDLISDLAKDFPILRESITSRREMAFFDKTDEKSAGTSKNETNKVEDESYNTRADM